MRVLAHDWLGWLEEVWGAKPSMIKDYRSSCASHGEAFKRGPGKTAGRIMKAFGDRPAAEVTTREVSDFLRSLDREGLTPAQRERSIAWCSPRCSLRLPARTPSGFRGTNPVLGTDKRRQAPPAALGYYEVEEVEVLWARACEEGGQREPREIFDEAEREPRRQEDKQDAEAFRLLFYTGLRVGEILTLRWGDSDLDGRGCSWFAAAYRLVWKDYRRAAVPASCLSPWLRSTR